MCRDALRRIHQELEYLVDLLESGHPDQRGIRYAIEDWILEEVLIMIHKEEENVR